MERDFKRDMEIDPGALDVEWLRQVKLHNDYADLATEANAALAKAEQFEKVVRSEIILEIKDKDPKATAQIIEAMFRTDQRHKDAKRDLLRAMENAEAMQNALHKINTRKVALENMVRLHAANYFAGPKEPRDLPAEYKAASASRREDQAEETRDRVQDRMRTRTRA